MTVYRDKEELNKDLAEEQKKLFENLTKNMARTRFKIKSIVIFLISLIIIAIVLYRIFVGEINIPNLLGYNKNRWYHLRINDEVATVEVFEEKTNTLIPKFLNLKSYSLEKYYGSSFAYEVVVLKSEDYNLNLISYKCLEKKKQIPCDNNIEDVKREIMKDTEYSFYIEYKATKEVLYNGPMIDNLKDYLPYYGTYAFRIEGKYKNVVSHISTWILVVDEKTYEKIIKER